MIHVTVLAVKIVTRSKFLDKLEERLHEIHGDDVEMVRYLCSNDYWDRWRKASNLITWGIKWTSERYRKPTGMYKKGKNTLYVENGLFDQKRGLYVDHLGYFSDSSMVIDGTNAADYTEAEAKHLSSFTRRSWGYNFGEECNPDGPIIVAVQTNNDAPMRHHFPGGVGATGKQSRKKAFLELCREHLPRDREVIIRPHPKERDLPDGFKMPDNWRIDDHKRRIYPMLREASAVVAVNSTVATEAMALNIPVATLGTGSWTGTEASLDCSQDASLVAGILDTVPDMEARTRYLCEILRNHQIPYGGKNIPGFLDRSNSVDQWIKNLHHIDEAPKYRRNIPQDGKETETKPKAEAQDVPAKRKARAQRRRRRKPRGLKVCLFCGNDTPDTGCSRCKCQKCGKRNC